MWLVEIERGNEVLLSMNSPRRLSRRRVLAAFVGASLSGACSASAARAQKRFRVAGLFAGQIDDKGFMEAGYRGLTSARDRLGVDIVWRDQVKPERDLLIAALRELASENADLVIAHGGQNNEAAKATASQFPSMQFVVTQGSVTGPNLASYEVLQEESAFLAGALAGWATKTGTVGHMSGIRVVPGLKGRAAFANGVAFANPQARLLTNFSGSQDDNALSKRVAAAMIDAKAPSRPAASAAPNRSAMCAIGSPPCRKFSSPRQSPIPGLRSRWRSKISSRAISRLARSRGSASHVPMLCDLQSLQPYPQVCESGWSNLLSGSSPGRSRSRPRGTDPSSQIPRDPLMAKIADRSAVIFRPSSAMIPAIATTAKAAIVPGRAP
jgi:ABC transporter substrate-binding protein PnrA-like